MIISTVQVPVMIISTEQVPQQKGTPPDHSAAHKIPVDFRHLLYKKLFFLNESLT
jgi:hypothetical protein